MKDIIDWLNDPRDYNKGVHLYEMYGGYKSVVTLLTNHRNPDKLKTVLRDLKAKLPTVTSTPIPVSPQLSPQLKQIDAAWYPLFAEMSMYHARMAAVGTDAERRVLAHKVVALEKDCAVEWERRDYFIQHQTLLPAKTRKPKKVTKAGELSANDHKRLTNLRTYVSINKRELASLEAEILVTKDETLLRRLRVKQTKKVAQMAEKEAEIKKLENNETT